MEGSSKGGESNFGVVLSLLVGHADDDPPGRREAGARAFTRR